LKSLFGLVPGSTAGTQGGVVFPSLGANYGLIYYNESTGRFTITSNSPGTVTVEVIPLLTVTGGIQVGGNDSTSQVYWIRGFAATAGLGCSADGVLNLTNGGSGGAALEFTEVAVPAAPAANKGRLYCKDNGSGKTQLVMRFPTGVEQVIATEP
jgi:hypothetical protein